MTQPAGSPRDGDDPQRRARRLDDWSRTVADSRGRADRLMTFGQPADVAPDSAAALAELSTAYEELAVAEDELRAQNEQLIRAQTDLEMERARLASLFEDAPIAYVVTDGNGVVRRCNRAACRLLRRDSRHVVGRPLAIFTAGDSRREFRELVTSLRASASVHTAFVDVQRREGDPVSVQLTGVASDCGGGREIRWLLIDQRPRRRSEQRRAERAAALERIVRERTAALEQAKRAREEMIATVSHELRTPLAAIGGYCDLLSLGIRGALSSEQRADIERIRRAFEHMTGIVDDLLNYSRLTANRLALDIGRVSVAAAVASVVELVAPQAGGRDITLSVRDVDSSLVVDADPERVRQILVNLMSNAVKYIPPGASVRVEARAIPPFAVIEVADDGPGIPEGARETIFEPFVRLRTPEDVSGTGLGLPISRELARAMGGDLTVSSVERRGSVFELRLPLST